MIVTSCIVSYSAEFLAGYKTTQVC